MLYCTVPVKLIIREICVISLRLRRYSVCDEWGLEKRWMNPADSVTWAACSHLNTTMFVQPFVPGGVSSVSPEYWLWGPGPASGEPRGQMTCAATTHQTLLSLRFLFRQEFLQKTSIYLWKEICSFPRQYTSEMFSFCSCAYVNTTSFALLQKKYFFITRT